MKRILIISHDKIGSKMAGTGMRYHSMAETLTEAGFDVTVGFFGPDYLPDDDFKRSYNVESVNVHQFEKAFGWADAIIAMWVSEAIIHFCNLHKKTLIFDIYAPVPVETMALKTFSGKEITAADEFEFESSHKDYRKFLENGDAFLVSNQRQLDFWIGYAFGAGQTSPERYMQRNIFDQFLIAPMGIHAHQKLTHTKTMYKGVLKGVAKDDIVMIWNGGIYDWYDGVTLIEAMELVHTMNPKIKMIFPGTVHPNKNLPKWQETINTQERAKELKVEGKNVFFFNSWVDYHDRINFLLEADIAIYTHKPSIESEFSHRTRVLDHILATIPTIATKGDHFASLVEQHGLGAVVEAYDKKALADAIVALAEPRKLAEAKRNLEKIRPSFDWAETLKPLITYLQSNPEKVPQTAPLRVTPLQNKKLSFVKKHTPLVVKKAAVKAMPKRIRNKLIG